MEKVVLSENELAQHWGVSPKTLQRRRSEGRGPRYLKLSKRVVYPLAEVRTFEYSALYSSTSEKANGHKAPSRSNLVTAKDAAIATSLPAYMFNNKRIREAIGKRGIASQIDSWWQLLCGLTSLKSCRQAAITDLACDRVSNQ